ncbi:anhydro-N-acetylmuramic acid kinase AnmK [Neobacillus sp. D3-1R]|uniref:anhydro-N-acetylmuramic acid kinase AnmK n=1 Tax=Neobacillus sp. D3-1R TaxID=3445778 RepID=UPI003FA12A02
MYAVGLMSGTSLDGIDAALVEIENSGAQTKIQLLDFQTNPFSPEIKAEIQDCLSLEKSTVQLICSVNFKLGHLLAESVKTICQKNNLPFEKLDFIGSHGQTIYHQPSSQGLFIPSTLQIGEPAVIAYETDTIVVSNFRTMDMAAGGQGAPLVPFSEFVLYRSEQKNRLLQNIGGIGNVTVIPKNADIHHVTAFDTGPGNMIIDEICQRLFHIPFDEGGKLAAQGKVDANLLKELMATPYLSTKPPKTTGRELFGKEFTTHRILKNYAHLSKFDLLTTVTMFTAQSIAANYQQFIFPKYSINEVIIGGGGSYNTTLVSMIKELLKNECEVFIQEDLGFSSEAKEAIAFAILANETLHGNTSNVQSATGARESVILGNITLPPRRNI